MKAERFITGAAYLINFTNTFVELGNRTKQNRGEQKYTVILNVVPNVTHALVMVSVMHRA